MSLLGKYATWFLILFPAFLLLGVAYYFSESLFFADDFHLLKTIVWMQDADSWAGKLELLTQQHNEHRIVVPRLITWLNYKFLGHIDWPVLIIFGNLIWCGILYFLWSAFRVLKYPSWYFLPIPWLLFQPAYYDNYTWTISILQQSVIVFLLAWLVHAFATRRFGLAVSIVLLGTFTHGNGIFGFGIGLVFLVLYREWRLLAWWLALAVVVALAYFYGFQKGQNADFVQSLFNPGRLIAYFFAFMGSLTQIFGPYDLPAVLWGGIVFLSVGVASLVWVFTHWGRVGSMAYFDKVLLGNFLFVAITALLVAVSRSWGASDLIMPPRYAHYSPYLTSWFYLLSLSLLPQLALSTKIWSRVWVLGAFAVCAVSYAHYLPKIVQRRDVLRADEANWKAHTVFMDYPPSFNRNIKEVYLTAVQRGICRNNPTLPGSLSKSVADSTIVLSFKKTEMVTQEVDRTLHEPMLRIGRQEYRGATPMLALVPDRGAAVWLPLFRPRNAYRAMLGGDGLLGHELVAEVLLENLPVGKYQLAFFNSSGSIYTRYNLVINATHEYRIF